MGNIPQVSAPELEQPLVFNKIDHILQFSGAAHISGRNIISTEAGAVIGGAHALSVQDLLHFCREGFAGGVNTIVFHGMPYGGEYMATWPGYTPLNWLSGELWSPRMPYWEHLSDAMAYISRNQLVLQSGAAKVDLAFYLHQDTTVPLSMKYKDDDLRDAGMHSP